MSCTIGIQKFAKGIPNHCDTSILYVWSANDTGSTLINGLQSVQCGTVLGEEVSRAGYIVVM